MYHKMPLKPSSPSAATAAPAADPSRAFRCGLSFAGKDPIVNMSLDAINLITAGRIAQPSAKLLDNWFNGNSTRVNICPRPK